MRISFDLDDTLVCPGAPADARRPPWPLRRLFPESLRAGTRDLLRILALKGCEIWIYTTSFRSPLYVRGWCGSLGIPIRGVVNQDRHVREVGRDGPSKHPGRFGIELHVDDSEGVAREGERHGFDVLVVRPDDQASDDQDWHRKVLDEVAARLDRDRPADRLDEGDASGSARSDLRSPPRFVWIP